MFVLGDRDKPTAPFEDRLSWVTESPTAFQAVPPQHMLAMETIHPHGYDNTGWGAVHMMDLRHFKDEMTPYWMPLSYVKQTLNI